MWSQPQRQIPGSTHWAAIVQCIVLVSMMNQAQSQAGYFCSEFRPHAIIQIIFIAHVFNCFIIPKSIMHETDETSGLRTTLVHKSICHVCWKAMYIFMGRSVTHYSTLFAQLYLVYNFTYFFYIRFIKLIFFFSSLSCLVAIIMLQYSALMYIMLGYHFYCTPARCIIHLR